MTSEERGFLAAIKKNPKEATARGAFADWLDEHDRPYEAILQRDAAGLSEVYFKLRRKSDGLFSEGSNKPGGKHWSAKGKMWRQLQFLRAHLRTYVVLHRGRSAFTRTELKYHDDTAWDDLEIVAIEVRATVGAVLPVTCRFEQSGPIEVSITEPLGEATPDA
ncbi:MAG TPA: TIGR02996 domain-containing protein [Gemmata sp.]